MPVGTGNIKLSDVTLEIYGDVNAGRSLVGCFAVAAGTFHPTYGIGRDSLLDFRGYDKRVYDQQGNVYGAIKIGDQVWMDSCLITTMFLDGNYLNWIENPYTWEYTALEAMFYDNEQPGIQEGGRWYNCAAIRSSKKLAPLGWHIPTKEEFQTLIDYIGGDDSAGALKALTSWQAPNTGASNSSGFKCLGKGFINSFNVENNGLLSNYYQLGVLAASTLTNNQNDVLILHYDSTQINIGTVPYFNDGVNVRCIRNKYIELQFVSASSTATSVTYTNKVDGGQDGVITSRGIEINGVYGTTPITNGQASCSISGLIPSTSYTLRVYATSSVYGTISAYYSITTTVAFAFGSPGYNFNVDDNEIELIFPATIYAGTLDSYYIYYMDGIVSVDEILNDGLSTSNDSFLYGSMKGYMPAYVGNTYTAIAVAITSYGQFISNRIFIYI